VTESLRRCGVILLGAALVACGAAEAKQKAEKGVVDFHAKFNASQFHEMYQGSSAAFQKASSEKDYLEFITAVRKKPGEVKSSRPAGWRFNANTSGSYVMLGYDTTYENGTAQESFDFEVHGNVVKLVGWHINSRELIVN
jgi:hypothetical protein